MTNQIVQSHSLNWQDEQKQMLSSSADLLTSDDNDSWDKMERSTFGLQYKLRTKYPVNILTGSWGD